MLLRHILSLKCCQLLPMLLTFYLTPIDHRLKIDFTPLSQMFKLLYSIGHVLKYFWGKACNTIIYFRHFQREGTRSRWQQQLPMPPALLQDLLRWIRAWTAETGANCYCWFTWVMAWIIPLHNTYSDEHVMSLSGAAWKLHFIQEWHIGKPCGSWP